MTAAIPRAISRAPGSVGNLGPGLDVLGCAVTGAHDEVCLEWSDAPGVTVLDAGHPDLPSAPERNTAAIAASEALARARAQGARCLAEGLALRVTKGLPLSGGQGGSAASAVAGAVALNTLVGRILSNLELAECALVAESRVAGRHLDNIAPSLLGGLVLVRSVDPLDLVPIATPAHLRIVLATPAQRLETARARAVLPEAVPRATAIHQMAQVGAIIAACEADDLALLGRAIDDRIAEPVRASLIPGFREVKLAAMETGALGVSISGAGPTIFALCDGDARAAAVAAAMHGAFARLGIESTVRVTAVSRHGASGALT